MKKMIAYRGASVGQGCDVIINSCVNYSLIDDIKARTRFEDILNEVASPSHQQGYKIWYKCLFHNEKTASYMLDKNRQIGHCFGCHWHGDVIQFTKDYYHLSFNEARNHLAVRAGIPIPESTPETRKAAKEAFRKRHQEKQKMNSARQLIREQYSRLCDLEQAAYRIIRTIKTEEDLERPEVVAALKSKDELGYMLNLWSEVDESARFFLALAVKGVQF